MRWKMANVNTDVDVIERFTVTLVIAVLWGA